MKVFGIGLNKTGTKTLGQCMSVLGFKNKSYDLDLLQDFAIGDFNRIMKVSEIFDSFEDWPWPLLYQEFDKKYPDALFILTTRTDSTTWFNSLCKHAERTGPTQARKIVYGYLMPMENPDYHMSFYSRYNDDVENYFLKRPEKLLKVCWEQGDGWNKLCSFLDLPLPVIPFPHINKA